MSGGKSSTSCADVGWRYKCGLHLIFCTTVDVLREVTIGEHTAWTGTVVANTKIAIDNWNLFGGDDREGGIATSLTPPGTPAPNVDVEFGLPSQGANSYLSSVLGYIPAYRGLFGLVLNKSYVSANSTYLKPWKIKATRTNTGWEPSTAAIGLDMNPAHIIRECLTNTTWGGLGLPESEIDNDCLSTGTTSSNPRAWSTHCSTASAIAAA